MRELLLLVGIWNSSVVSMMIIAQRATFCWHRAIKYICDISQYKGRISNQSKFLMFFLFRAAVKTDDVFV